MSIKDLSDWILGLIQPLIGIVFSLGLLYFLWGMVGYIRAESAGGKGDAKTSMGWGLLALFVMSSVWGIVAFLRRSLF